MLASASVCASVSEWVCVRGKERETESDSNLASEEEGRMPKHLT